MHTRNVNVRTAAQESSRKIGGKTVSYTILVAEKKKNSAPSDEWDVMEFDSLAAEADHFKQFVRLIKREGFCIQSDR